MCDFPSDFPSSSFSLRCRGGLRVLLREEPRLLLGVVPLPERLLELALLPRELLEGEDPSLLRLIVPFPERLRQLVAAKPGFQRGARAEAPHGLEPGPPAEFEPRRAPVERRALARGLAPAGTGGPRGS